MIRKRASSPLQATLWDGYREAALMETPSSSPSQHGLSGFKEVDWSFPGSTDRAFTHSMHPWPAKFIPDIPSAAIAMLSDPGDTVLDPFCGCGTTAVEALVSNREVIAIDVNPLAVLITKGKCQVPGPAERLEIFKWAKTLAPQIASEELLAAAPQIPNLPYWFDEPVIAQLVYLLREIRAIGVAPAFLETVFSSIIVGVSHQESETRYRRIERATSAEDTLARFRRRLSQGLDMALSTEGRISVEGKRTFEEFDARKLSDCLPPACAHLAVFSPPYPNSFDYHLYHRFRMFWLGMNPVSVKHSEIGAHLRYQPDHFTWLDDMRCVFQGVVHCLRRGGFAVCVVGNGIIQGETIHSGSLLWEMAPAVGLTPKWRTTRTVPGNRKSFNLADARIGREEVLVFQR